MVSCNAEIMQNFEKILMLGHVRIIIGASVVQNSNHRLIHKAQWYVARS
jgi:hypothetical protein